MITSKQCRVGLRVKWVSIQLDMPVSRGTVVLTSGNSYTVKWDEDDEDDEDEHPTYVLNDSGSRIFPLKDART